ncbi:UNVERIFIED_CONTAM: Retrovirus-related Pol polyprotein from transposon RE1, partial [Sesamum radiatum]
KRAIGSKWVFKTKLRADGSVERYKGRLIAKGYNQIEGIDYTDNFSLVAEAITVKLFLTLVVANGWALQLLDVNNAFLHDYLDEDIYMTPPKGYQVKPCLVCKLERSLYGLKQASFKKYVYDLFSIKDIRDVRYFPGLETARNSDVTYLAQTNYAPDIIKDTGLKYARTVSTPFPQGLKLSLNLVLCFRT